MISYPSDDLISFKRKFKEFNDDFIDHMFVVSMNFIVVLSCGPGSDVVDVFAVNVHILL